MIRKAIPVQPKPVTDEDKELLIKTIPVELEFRLGDTKMKIEDILKLGPGAIIELDKKAYRPLDILIKGKHIGSGEVVKVGDKYGIRIIEIFKGSEESEWLKKRLSSK